MFKTIQSRLSFLVGMGIFITVSSIIIYTSVTTSNIAIENAKNNISSQADEFSFYIKNTIETALNNSRTMSYMLTTVHNDEAPMPMSRESLMEMTHTILKNYDELLGVWSYWESNAFDGKDSQYRINYLITTTVERIRILLKT